MNLPIDNEVFDTVLLASLLNVVPERLKLLREVNRVLKPGGMISVLFPTPAFENEKAIEISTQLNLGEISTAAISVWARVARKLQPDEICDEFSMANFENISIKLHFENNIASITGYKANTQFRARAKRWRRSR